MGGGDKGNGDHQLNGRYSAALVLVLVPAALVMLVIRIALWLLGATARSRGDQQSATPVQNPVQAKQPISHIS